MIIIMTDYSLVFVFSCNVLFFKYHLVVFSSRLSVVENHAVPSRPPNIYSLEIRRSTDSEALELRNAWSGCK